jgi:hypothetical protein
MPLIREASIVREYTVESIGCRFRNLSSHRRLIGGKTVEEGGRGYRFSRISSANSNVKGSDIGNPPLDSRLTHLTRVDSSVEVSDC